MKKQIQQTVSKAHINTAPAPPPPHTHTPAVAIRGVLKQFVEANF